MKKTTFRHFIVPVFLVFFILLQSSGCSQDKPKKNSRQKPAIERNYISEIVYPKQGEVFKCGDSVNIRITIKDKTAKIDSVVLSSLNSESISYRNDLSKIYYPAGNKVGQKIIKAEIFYNDTLSERQSLVIVLLSDIVPKEYKIRIVNTYPHDVNAYTQGLIFNKGILYESTGQKGKSSIRKVDIKSGKPIKKTDLEPQYFGEGIALVKDYIYQITWQNQLGFIYDRETLDLVRTFVFSINQGWGLTSFNDRLFMTDGSSFLYTIEPEYFSQIDQIEVFNHLGRVADLNELEYINGKIFANVYGEPYIVIIDPLSGKVTGTIDMKNNFPKGIEKDNDHVLNGIAFNPANNHLFLTGKLWPVIYEVTLEGFF